MSKKMPAFVLEPVLPQGRVLGELSVAECCSVFAPKNSRTSLRNCFYGARVPVTFGQARHTHFRPNWSFECTSQQRTIESIVEEIAGLENRIKLINNEYDYYSKSGLDTTRYTEGLQLVQEKKEQLIEELAALGGISKLDNIVSSNGSSASSVASPAPPPASPVVAPTPAVAVSPYPSTSPRISPLSYTKKPHPKLFHEPHSFMEAMQTYFPGSVPADDWVQYTYLALEEFGFNQHNSIPMVSLCRDEICRPLYNKIQEEWCPKHAGAFNMSALAGVPFLGKTGLMAGQHHSPVVDGFERYVYVAMPHIAIDEEGKVGSVSRAGRTAKSSACGALIAFQKELDAGTVDISVDRDDVEISHMKQLLLSRISYGTVPNLVALTKLAASAILDIVERGVMLTVDPQKAHYAVLTGVQIHGPDDRDYIYPGVMYCKVDFHRYQINVPSFDA